MKSQSKFYSYFNDEFFKADAKAADCLIEFDTFLSYLNTNEVFVGRTGKGEKSYGKLDILKLISELFTDKFQLYANQFEEIKQDFESFGISLNLSKELECKKSSYIFSEVMFNLYKKYDSRFGIDHDLQHAVKQFNNEFGIVSVNGFDLVKWEQAISFLRLLSDITFKLSNVKDTKIFMDGYDDGKKISINNRESINWCSYCFRRASKKGPQRYSQIESSERKYDLTCRIHNSKNDKVYREAKNRAKLLAEADRKFINQIHAERISYELHKPRYEIEFVTNEEWLNFGASWIEALQKKFPDENLKQIINWDQFVTKFHLLFENYEETTNNPKWIMDIFVEAEIWLNLEKNNPKIDKRRNPK